ncbi:MAG: endonuclease NucS [Candidatus Thermoplasmatota archaeon]
MTHVVINPTIEDAYHFIRHHHVAKTDKTNLVLIGDCLIEYNGRARSLLDWGERIVLIKQDGNVIVHRPMMREPVNWQPAGSTTAFSIDNSWLILRSRHTPPPEKMKIIFRMVKVVVVTTLRDQAEFVIAGMEDDVVKQIVLNPNIIEEGLRISQREKYVKSGAIDLFGYDKNHTPVIIEVKRSIATISSVHQLRMYVCDIKRDNKEAKVRGILCAPKIPDMVRKLLVEYNLEWREVERTVVLPDDLQKTLQDF